MPVYQYSAMDSSGKERKGTKDAANEVELTAFLKEQGMFPTSIKLARAGVVKKAAGASGAQKAKKASNMILNISFGPIVI